MDINVIRLRSSLQYENKQLDKESNNFIEEINNELINDDIILKSNITSKMNILLCETGGIEGIFLKNIEKFSYPLLILANGKNNSFPAALEIKTYCNTHHRSAIVLTGKESNIAPVIRRFARVIHAKESIKGDNLGIIGNPSDWLIASKVDEAFIKETFGLNIVKIGMDEFFHEIDKRKMEKISHFEDFDSKFEKKEVLSGALYIYSALKRLINKYKLSGLTVRCFDLLGKYKNTSCLALAMLNSEGITSACEGDMPSLITMHLLKAITGRSCFQANPSFINEEDHSILLAHCTLPLNMCKDYSLTTHFESGLGIGVKGNLLLDTVTICKCLPNEKGLTNNFVSITGKIVENKSLKGYCRTQIYVSLEPFDFLELMDADFGNHLIVTYGDVSSEFAGLLSAIQYEIKKEA